MYKLVMEEKTDTNFLGGSRSGSNPLLDGYYSVQFSLNSNSPSYIFKLHNTSLSKMCILVKNDSFVFKQLKIGDILNMEFNQPGSPNSTKALKTKIRSKIAHDRFIGHSFVGLSIMDKKDENLWIVEDQTKLTIYLPGWVIGHPRWALNLKRINRMDKNLLKEIRESLMMSKTELAKKAGISPITITRIEKGIPCRMKTKRKILSALGLKVSDKKKVFDEVNDLSGKEKQNRRLGADRRKFSYHIHIPENRAGNDRRAKR